MPADHPIYYDARLIDATDANLIIEHQGERIELPTFPNVGSVLSCWIGQIGVVQFAPEGDCWRFMGYVDQSLRRVCERDSTDGFLGWRCDAKPDGFLAKNTIIPGDNGAFVEDETEELTINVPPEFYDLCERFGRTPESILQGFIADACELMNATANPREDGFSSHGSDERRLAYDYLERAYPSFED